MSTSRAQASVAFAAVLWGTSGIVANDVLAAGFGAVELGFWRLAMGGALFALHARRTNSFRLHRPADLRPLLLLGVFVIAGNYAAFGLALEHGGMSLVNLFIALAPGFIAAGAYIWFREKVGLGTILLVAVGVCGLALAALGNGAGVTITPASIGFGAMTTMTTVGLTLGTKALLDRYTPVALSAFVMIIGALTLLPFARLESRSMLTWLGVLLLGVGPTYLAHLMYVRGLEALGATTTGILASLDTPIALCVAALLLGERFTLLGVVGVGMVVTASALVITKPSQRVRRRQVAHPDALRALDHEACAVL